MNIYNCKTVTQNRILEHEIVLEGYLNRNTCFGSSITSSCSNDFIPD